ncbi:uncharacterized protein K452DRAFT_47233 [Aplosporella prunicola CBS 121167]|uniref:Uncharacterized protein n=1 Tax=Aplosporella prunicola CBS 121167 TaxID=1176127 RepID=A0A6A6BA72_9PEZI|nr:uncharacterized protein K452DRAFT_47233 [Aplosporella prunicola CBS 121167]KAF2140478.1 hypothetical protein K452DRAFT_47233 [Aplosporella prunicola CBS 121167]
MLAVGAFLGSDLIPKRTQNPVVHHRSLFLSFQLLPSQQNACTYPLPYMPNTRTMQSRTRCHPTQSNPIQSHESAPQAKHSPSLPCHPPSHGPLLASVGKGRACRDAFNDGTRILRHSAHRSPQRGPYGPSSRSDSCPLATAARASPGLHALRWPTQVDGLGGGQAGDMHACATARLIMLAAWLGLGLA